MAEKTEAASESDNSAEDAIKSLDQAFDNPTMLDRFIASIEDDLSGRTPPRRNIIGQFKRIFLRGVVSVAVSGFLAAIVSLSTILVGYAIESSAAVGASIFIPLSALIYTTMLTDWLPKKPDQ